LVVDDSALVRKLVGQAFAGEPDFELGFARDGIEALAVLQSFKPDVMTLDVHMPQMDGLACLDRIMVERPCPVVMVSSRTSRDADETLEALRLGAVDFVPKPPGAVSLHMEAWGPMLVATVRGAAGAKLKSSLRLKERVRRQFESSSDLSRPGPSTGAATAPIDRAAPGDGLVLVGTSTGGPPALEALLTALPEAFPWPILVAQHMPASFTGALARRLDGICALTVKEVRQMEPLSPGVVYIGRGEADLIVSKRGGAPVALAAPPLPGYPWRPSTDRLVRTAMDHVPAARLIGVLMTGMGNDGAAAMTHLREQGGRTIAEAEETAVVWGMPGELIKAGGASFIEPLPAIADRLLSLAPPCL
jgi:two-component system chemotaxis response regulator CheB